jgi:exodeoxyribonuclease VII large subunit
LIDRAELSMSAAASARHWRSGLWSVGASRTIADSLDAKFNPVFSDRLISGYSRAASGHCYFSLKDAGSGALCDVSTSVQPAGLFSQDGQQVELRGRLSVVRGELQLIVWSR